MTSQKLSNPLGLFGLKSLYEYVILIDKIEPIACLVFYLVIKGWGNLYKKAYQTLQTAVKTFKKGQNAPTGKPKQIQILFNRFLGEYTLGGAEGGGGLCFKKSQRRKRRGEEKYKICNGDGILSF